MIVQPCYPDIEREEGVQYQKFELWHGPSTSTLSLNISRMSRKQTCELSMLCLKQDGPMTAVETVIN